MKSREIKAGIPKKRQLKVKLQQMQRDSQSRDRSLVAKGGAVDDMFLIHPNLVRNAKIVWPADD